VQCSAGQYSAVQCSAVQCRAVLSALQFTELASSSADRGRISFILFQGGQFSPSKCHEDCGGNRIAVEIGFKEKSRVAAKVVAGTGPELLPTGGP
jgi:hypothetical protein